MTNESEWLPSYGALPKSHRLRRLMCGRPLAFRQDCPLDLGLRPFVGAKPLNFIGTGTEAQSASAHQAAKPPTCRQSLLMTTAITLRTTAACLRMSTAYLRTAVANLTKTSGYHR